MSRKYDVAELDDLRSVVQHKWLFGTYSIWSDGGSSRSYMPGEMEIAVEQMVRTHMLAGHTADDLRASERPKEQREAG